MLSPVQSSALAMGRALLLLSSWEKVDDGPIELERAILIDFVIQNPRFFLAFLSDLDPILRAYNLQEAGIADMFAQRRLETTRERFQATISELLSRDLIAESDGEGTTESAVFRITASGKVAAGRFTSELSRAIRAVATVACTQWRRRNHRELQRMIRNSLPDQSSEASRLTRPFAEWLLEMDS